MALSSLITSDDSWQIATRAVASILAADEAMQRQLATAAKQDPEQWRLRIFEERDTSFEEYLQDQGARDLSPVVNVYAQRVDMELQTGAGHAKGKLSVQVDVFGFGVATDDGTNTIPADLAATRRCHRATMLVRKILSCAENRYLGMPQGIITSHKIEGIDFVKPSTQPAAVACIMVGQIRLSITLACNSPDRQLLELAGLNLACVRAEDGRVLFEENIEL